MNILGAIGIDFTEQLKRKTKSWVVTPLVTGNIFFPHSGKFLFTKPCSNNKSSLQHYTENPPTADHTFIQLKQPGKPLRLVGLRLEPEECKIHLSFWRASGFVKREMSIKDYRRTKVKEYSKCPDSYNSLILCRMHHITRTNKKKEINWHSFDLTSPEPSSNIIDLIIAIINKSYEWIGRGKFEKFGRYQHPVMIDLNGKNYTTNERVGGGWLY